jgi:ribosomal protein L7Ae-like RNA K-turn-binding protein
MDDTTTPAEAPKKPVERLFPFVIRSRGLIVGRETLSRSKSKLHFILITTDLSENSVKEVLTHYSHYPVVQRYTSAELETFFGVKATKVVGFQKSGLAQSIYAELKEFRLNRPALRVSAKDQAAQAPKVEPGTPDPGATPTEPM